MNSGPSNRALRLRQARQAVSSAQANAGALTWTHAPKPAITLRHAV